MRNRISLAARTRRIAIAAAASLIGLCTIQASPVGAQEPLVIPAPDLGGGQMMDTYLWHVRGLPPGARLAVYSGAGPNFRVIHMLDEGSPIERLNCRESRESRGGYWCRVATVDRPRISGWVDGRFLLEDAGFMPYDDRRLEIQPIIPIPLPNDPGRPPRPHRP
jgi:hypothetical protein